MLMQKELITSRTGRKSGYQKIKTDTTQRMVLAPTLPRNDHETSIKPVLEIKFPRVDARDYHWFIQQVCQQGSDEGRQRKPDLKVKGKQRGNPRSSRTPNKQRTQEKTLRI